MVLAVAVSAGRKFAEIRFVAHRLQLRCHLAGVARMGSVILAARGYQDWWISVAGRSRVIGRNLCQEFPIFWLVWIAELVGNCRTNEQLVVAAHVDDWHCAEQRAEPLRIARQHVCDEKAAVRPAFRSD